MSDDVALRAIISGGKKLITGIVSDRDNGSSRMVHHTSSPLGSTSPTTYNRPASLRQILYTFQRADVFMQVLILDIDAAVLLD